MLSDEPGVVEKPGRKCKWTMQEDELLKEAVARLGCGCWAAVSDLVPGRTGKQCRERWVGHLAQNIKRKGWSLREDRLLLQSRERYGNKWTIIAREIQGRSAISIKNRWKWLVRHGVIDSTSEPVMREGQTRGSDVRMEFEMPAFDDAIFGARFREFQAQLSL